MNIEVEPVSVTVFRKRDGTWWTRLWDDSGALLKEAPIPWDGEGDFYTRGLAFVRLQIPDGYDYLNWEELGDETYTAVLRRLDPHAGL
ncbi:hypothetical protein [Sinomonas mesophila]|uniref:hypothetical protein n=1 Tax=Sinomonas mesophila TaxID=1531955 RepID=UPI00098744DA|nr:hypothetical protein [Sinomonas mesophila]